VPEDATFYEGRGCRKCLGLGYRGRTPIFEIMAVTAALAEAIEGNAPATRLRDIARSEGMVQLAEAGLQQAIVGTTTVEEVFYKVSG
jgi:type II secretory ATPase GspE/PulE/Tfp pilus assembly ATPase PilB-like protein